MKPASRYSRPTAMLLGLVLFAANAAHAQQPASRAESSAAAPLVPLRTRWPVTTAVAVFAPQRVNATAVEATSDGWIVLTPLIGGAEARDHYPYMRLRAKAADALRWAEAARRLATALADSVPGPHGGDMLPKLGRGRAHLEVWGLPRERSHRVGFLFVTCDNVGASYDVSPAELGRIADRFESAARAAMRASPTPVPPTLDRPYYGSEVSCPATADGSNGRPRLPADLPESERRYGEVAVRFVVDTAGFVEPGSIAILPGAPARLATVARTLVSGWRFQPAEWGHMPVRQIVAQVLAFDPGTPDPRARIAAESLRAAARAAGLPDPPGNRPGASVQRADPDGWVHVRMGQWRPNGTFDGYQEWFHPDSVEAWAARAKAYVAADDANPRKPPTPYPDTGIVLGSRVVGNRYALTYQNGWSPSTTRLALIGSMMGCGGATIGFEPFDASVPDLFAQAATEARARRSSPLPPAARIYLRGEVACPAQLPPLRVGRDDLPGVWRHPKGRYPRSMAATHARAEVVSSFVVDTTGTPLASTLVVMPGSDPRAVAALRASIGDYRFQPASRAGVKVRMRVVRTWLFEPAPQCADEDAGIECAREYSHQQ